MRLVGEPVAAVEEVPGGFVDLAAFQRREMHALFSHAPPLLLDLLALVAVQAGQKICEVGKWLWLAVLPVELHPVAQQPAATFGLLRFAFAQKQKVGRRPALRFALG